MTDDDTYYFRVDRETDVRSIPGMGDTGTKVEIKDTRSATNKHCDTEIPAMRCPVCDYDRARVETDYNPEFGTTTTVTCHNCGIDLEATIKQRTTRHDDRGDDRR